MARARIRTGDVFVVRLDDARVVFGQVVAKYQDDGYYFALFDKAYPRAVWPALSDVVSDRVAILALSLDGKIAAGHWEIVGNEPVPTDLPLPAYKETVGTPDRVDIVDYSGERRRRAVGGEVDLLPNRKVVAPVRLEKALRALHGLEPWREAYQELRPVVATTSKRLFG